MFSTKSTFLLAVLSISIRLASAIPPACLLAAINTQSNPADLPTLCGKDSSDVQQQIRDLCGDNTEAALDAYRTTCRQLGLAIPDETTSSTSKPSKTASATSKSTDKSKPSSIAESTADTTTDADVSKTTDKSKSDSTAEPTADSTTDTVPRSSSAASALYPVTFTSTFFDSECSCTKTSTISSTPIAASSGYVIATGNASPTGLAGSSGGLGSGLGSGPGSAATGSPILPSATNERGTAATPSTYTGAASKHLGASGVGILAIISLVLAL